MKIASFFEQWFGNRPNCCGLHCFARLATLTDANCKNKAEEKKTLCEIALRVRPDFIKTSTGFGTPASGVGTSERDRLAAVGAALEDVRLMKSIVGNKIKVKAAGGIRTLEDALAMLEAGAERLGTSAGVRIIESLQSLNHEKYMEVEEHER